MSYDLEALPRALQPVDPAALVSIAQRVAPELSPRVLERGRVGCDGAGFALDVTARGSMHLSAGPERGERDEAVMERVALALAGGDGVVLDRHTGNKWPASLLAEWLRVGPLLSGRALALNEERIAHRVNPVAAQGFAARVTALTTHVAHGGSPALRARLHDELAHYASRHGLVWIVARGLATLGDFARFETLARTATADSEVNAFDVAAEYGRAALPMFTRALGDPDPNLRRAVARALHRVNDSEVLPLVARALGDKRSTVREAVLETGFDRVLALAGARVALEPVLTRLANDPSSVVRKAVARWS